MRITELTSLSESQTSDLLKLMPQLTSSIEVSAKMLCAAAENPSTHLFAVVDEEGRIAGCASLCITKSPTGVKGGIEDVVVDTTFRGQHIGRQLIEHIIAFAQENYAPVTLHLTSRPSREKANRLYQSVGFSKYDTNVYKLICE